MQIMSQTNHNHKIYTIYSLAWKYMLRTFFGEERGGRNQNSTYVYPLEFNPVFDGNTAITLSS